MAGGICCCPFKHRNCPMEFKDVGGCRAPRGFYQVEGWSKNDQQIEALLFAGSKLDMARAVMKAFTEKRPRARLTIRQRSRVLYKWPPA